jgi:hypothetical protein
MVVAVCTVLILDTTSTRVGVAAVFWLSYICFFVFFFYKLGREVAIEWISYFNFPIALTLT